ncbi:MAG: hypothetical protein KJ645_12865, partial [Planctomycetes bacterium]|nr:hypothetical protein [Planctomycetota bacterium]
MKKIAFLLSFVSGLALVDFVLAWTRMLAPVAGQTRPAEAGLMGLVLLGLALGSVKASRGVIGLDAYLRRYTWMVTGALAAGLFFPALAALVDAVYPMFDWIGLATQTGRLILCALILVPTTAFLGAQIPPLYGLALQDRNGSAAPAGFCLFALALGAGVAAASAGSGLFEAWVFSEPGSVALALHGLLLAGCLGLRYRLIHKGVLAEDEKDRLRSSMLQSGPAGSVLDEVRSSALFAALFCQGFSLAVLAQLWPAILVFINGNRIQAFASIALAALVGLALGGLIMGRISDRRVPDLSAGAIILFLSGALICLGLAAFSGWVELLRNLGLSMESSFGVGGFSPAFLLLGLPLFPGALGLGMIWPLAAEVQREGRKPSMRTFGLIAGAFFLGAGLGAFSTGSLVLPNLSIKLGVMVSGFMILASGLLVLCFACTGPGTKMLLMLANLCMVWFVAWFMAGQGGLALPLILEAPDFKQTLGRNHLQLEDYQEDLEGTVAVVRDITTQESCLYIDGRRAAVDGVQSQPKHLLAHLPLFFCVDPRRALVVGYGIGHVTGSLSMYPKVEELKVLERNPACLLLASHFARVNRRAGLERSKPGNQNNGSPKGNPPEALEGEVPEEEALEGIDHSKTPTTQDRDLQVRLLTRTDPAIHLRLDEEGYNVISLNGTQPFEGFNRFTWSAPFYGDCKDRLLQGGALCRALPLDRLSPDDFMLLLGTFLASFPESAFFLVEDTLLMVGLDQADWRLSWPHLRQCFEIPAVRSELASLGFAVPEALAGAYVGDSQAMVAVLPGLEPLQDRAWIPKTDPHRSSETGKTWAGENLALLMQVEASLCDRIAWDGEDRKQEEVLE